jgi:hypothetical protein
LIDISANKLDADHLVSGCWRIDVQYCRAMAERVTGNGNVPN